MRHAKSDPVQPRGPLAVLTSCLVDADSATRARAGWARRRALGASAIVQIIGLGLLLVVPLLATGHRLVIQQMQIIPPPYGGNPPPNRALPPQHSQQTLVPDSKLHPTFTHETQIIPPTRIPREIAESSRADEAAGPNLPVVPGGIAGDDTARIGLIPIPGEREGMPLPKPSVPIPPIPAQPVSVSQGVELAMLIHRVEPLYPTFAKQAHIEGLVELHAIISRDGTIEKLETLSGNPFLARAARDAVLQWRFRPTLLDKQPIEVDTYITVKFSLGQ